MRKVAALFTIALTLSSIGILTAQQEPGKNAGVSADTRILVAYNVKDLPVWSQNGTKFDATILIKLLLSKITPEKWGEEFSIKPYAANSSLVVAATRDMHDMIKKELVELRNEK
jgi:hypothetical protein